MHFPHLLDCDWWILGVVLAKVCLYLIRNTLRINGRAHFRLPFAQKQKHTVIYIVVNQFDVFFGTSDQIRHKHVCIESLTIKKQSSLKWNSGLYYIICWLMSEICKSCLMICCSN